jgi:hypothetical protein
VGEHEAFWIDHEYDRERAGDGRSRYGELLRREPAAFADAFGDIAPVTFACTAWRLATPPALSPGFVRWHRRVLTATCERNAWDGGMTARVELVAQRPALLAASRDWRGDWVWRDWPELFGQFLDPTDEDLAKDPYLRASVLVQAPVPLEGLPAAPEGPDDDVEATAHRAVAVLVRKLDGLIAPIVRQLELR